MVNLSVQGLKKKKTCLTFSLSVGFCTILGVQKWLWKKQKEEKTRLSLQKRLDEGGRVACSSFKGLGFLNLALIKTFTRVFDLFWPL